MQWIGICMVEIVENTMMDIFILHFLEAKQQCIDTKGIFLFNWGEKKQNSEPNKQNQ